MGEMALSTTQHLPQDVQGGTEIRGISRRTVARGMAWTAPVLLTSVTVPAFAASMPCVVSHAALQQRSSVLNGLAFSGSTITASLTYQAVNKNGVLLSDQTPEETGWVVPTPYNTAANPRWNYIKLHHPTDVAQGNVITLTIEFTENVENLSLTITDIDKNTIVNAPNRWIDEVVITPGGFTDTVPVKGANVIGAGTATNPYSSSVDENISTPAGDVTLTWAGPLKVVTIAYKAAGSNNVNDWGQQIGVGKISFNNC
jgi:hypothetical protein